MSRISVTPPVWVVVTFPDGVTNVLRHIRDMTAQAPGHRPETIDTMTTTQNTDPTSPARTGPLTGLASPRGRTALATTAALTSLTLALTACAGSSEADAPATPPASDARTTTAPPKVLLLGDSVGQDLALALDAAFEASGVEFESLASDGGGNVVGPFSEEQWETLPEEVEAAGPGLVIYQITGYDWGTEQEQREGYEKLVDTVTEVDATLLFVTMPPIEPDDFYEPHMEDLDRAPEVARSVAADSEGRAEVLEAGEVWGEDYRASRDGEPDRNPDGIHLCPQGAARLTHWMLDELQGRFPDIIPAAPEEWADTGWASDDRFGAC
ncbi:SGNH/GDSL hydrolase family protein [Nocardiopsis listeri]|uniref:SGNH/GDSL hydrolase family protein n=1 Tax=Nocardiopsis listeri TaxID=53440 RepID=UPI001CC1F46A|nr:SGNH/GDSL hydrolase family protein [Nocardiopsis listeri]